MQWKCWTQRSSVFCWVLGSSAFGFGPHLLDSALRFSANPALKAPSAEIAKAQRAAEIR